MARRASRWIRQHSGARGVSSPRSIPIFGAVSWTLTQVVHFRPTRRSSSAMCWPLMARTRSHFVRTNATSCVLLTTRNAKADLPPFAWRRDATYLITGGLGDVGLHVARSYGGAGRPTSSADEPNAAAAAGGMEQGYDRRPRSASASQRSAHSRRREWRCTLPRGRQRRDAASLVFSIGTRQKAWPPDPRRYSRGRLLR